MEIANRGSMLEMFEVGPYEDAYQFGFLIGQRFSNLIKSRLATDLILQHQLIPFSQSPQSQSLIKMLTETNKDKYPHYWDELLGTAAGASVPVVDLILLNFRKEILPFLPTVEKKISETETVDDCSTILVVNDSMAIAAHNEDANVALVGHTYLIKATLSNGISFTAYTYAGELPSCAFGFNSHGLAFTLNSVPPSEQEIVAGGIGRNFVSRDLLEATSLDNALDRIRSAQVSIGHSYNLIDMEERNILNVETASRNRVSVHAVGTTPFFHANMYLHLQVQQAKDWNSISRQTRAAELPKQSKADFLSLLGDGNHEDCLIYMRGMFQEASLSKFDAKVCKKLQYNKMYSGPTLYTLCTTVIDLDERTVSIIQGNPKNGQVSHVFPCCQRSRDAATESSHLISTK